MKAPWTRVPGAVVSRKVERRPTRRRSAKRSVENPLYEARKAVFLELQRFCFCCGKFVRRHQRTLHHLRGRAGSLFLDERFWRMAAEDCHTAIHRNAKQAIAKGHLAGPGQFDVPVPRGHGWCEGCGIQIDKCCLCEDDTDQAVTKETHKTYETTTTNDHAGGG